jgi:hypothetical protein
LPYGLLCGVAEEVLGTPVPAGDGPVESPAEDRVIRGLHDGCQLGLCLLGLLTLGDVPYERVDAHRFTYHDDGESHYAEVSAVPRFVSDRDLVVLRLAPHRSLEVLGE